MRIHAPIIAAAATIATGILTALVPLAPAAAQSSEPPPVLKVHNYLPHMTRPEVEDFLTRSDMVIIPVGALEQHGTHLPIGTDHLNGVERAKRIALRTDVLVVPILLPGQSPYHMGFAGTVTLPSTLVQEVYVESVKSLIRHGFKRFLMLNAHGGNRAITTFIVDRINQETAGIAVDLGAAAAPFMERVASGPPPGRIRGARPARGHRRDVQLDVPDSRPGGPRRGGAGAPYPAAPPRGDGSRRACRGSDRPGALPGRGVEG